MTLSEPGNLDDSDRYLSSLESIHDFDVYNGQNERVGKVVKAGRDRSETSPYLIINAGSWLASRQVLIALGNYRVNPKARRIDIEGWSKEEINRLPNYSTQVQIENAAALLETSTPLESEAALEDPIIAPIGREIRLPVASIETTPLQEVPVSVPNETATQFESSTRILDEEIIPLLAERVIVDRHKRKSGEVVVRKVIETEIIEVIVRREKLIVEQVSPEYKVLAVIDLGRTSTEETPSS